MSDQPILIIGAGVAGLSAAIALAEAGLRSIVVDQAIQPGGMIHRQPMAGGTTRTASATLHSQWQQISDGLKRHASLISIMNQHRYCGIDHTGEALVTGSTGFFVRPSGLILATGASERVRPRQGWTLCGVQTAGSIQIHLKTNGEAPARRILIAGSGPLLFAVGAQLANAGTPPVAIIESGRPFGNPVNVLALPAAYLREAAGYMATLLRHRVPIMTGAEIRRIETGFKGLTATIETRKGTHSFSADLIGLHDGISSNDYGATDCAMVPVLKAGDCREPLGARAAALDGRHVGEVLAARLQGSKEPLPPAGIETERRAQAKLKRMYASHETSQLSALPGGTVICRCENRTLDDLRNLGDQPTERELRLEGRFGMGACQGRFCGEWVNQLINSETVKTGIGAARWPVRPVSIAEILDAKPSSIHIPGE